jgi:hypothetical protein
MWQNGWSVLIIIRPSSSFCRAWWLMPLDVPQPVWLIVLTLLSDISTITTSLSRPHPVSDPGSQSRNYAGEKWPINFAETQTSMKRLGIFYMP